MLVLSRKINEEVVIGPDIVVTVLAVEGHRVRLGLKAPREVAIRRHELIGRPLDPVRSGSEHVPVLADQFRQRPR